MYEVRMEHWTQYLRRGKYFLLRHKPSSALKNFERAMKLCPVSRRRDLSETLYYLGVTFQKLGFKSGSIRSWEAAARIEKRGYSRQMLRRFINGYGMPKQICDEEDDWCAFYSVHLSRYLVACKKNSIMNPAERDMIHDLIWDAFCTLVRSVHLKGKGCGEKLAIFKSVRLSFPVPLVEREGSVIPVDFREKQVLTSESRCSCASGLPFGQCCGRESGIDELINGLF